MEYRSSGVQGVQGVQEFRLARRSFCSVGREFCVRAELGVQVEESRKRKRKASATSYEIRSVLVAAS
jgi:hypothetical protein